MSYFFRRNGKFYGIPMIIILLHTLASTAQNKQVNSTPSKSYLQKSFVTPPDSVKPSVYWYWMSDNISEAGVRKDIEAMKKIGIGRAFIGNIGYPKEEVPYGNVKLFSDEWWKITEAAITAATREGIDIGMFNSPGWSQSGGPWIKPEQTWFYQGKAFVDYLRRCNFLLQQGQPVNDVAYFIGEDAPKMTGVRNPEIPAGYQYDYINAEVIENRLSVKEGKLVLPDGISYRLLVLPQLETMRPAVLRKIKQLVQDGAVVLGPAPKRSPSLENYPAADAEIKQLAAKLWNKADGKQVKSAKYGKGLVLNGMTLEEAFTFLKFIPDCLITSPQPVLYTHRKTNDTDIYFVTNQSDKITELTCDFRVTGKQPEWWNAVTGDIRPLPEFVNNPSNTSLPLKLEAFESGFVVFKNNSDVKNKNAQNFPQAKELVQLTGPWTLRFDTAKRGPVEPVIFNQLEDWSKRQEDDIKNYSGSVAYTTTFKTGSLTAGHRFFLNLGSVKVMAKVKLNGKDMGTVWTAPWQTEVTGALKEGENQLEVEVVNTWVNRLIGDSKLPEQKRKTWSNVNPYKPGSPYDPSGLMGPVRLMSVAY